MQKVVCSVFDTKAAVYSNPFYSVNTAVAARDFAHGCNDPNSALHRNPDDYILYQVASFDDETGLFTPCVPPVFVAAANTSISQGEQS